MKKQLVAEIIKNFKAMSLLLKFIFLAGIYSLYNGVSGIIGNTVVTVSYFGTTLSQSNLFIWRLFIISMALFHLYSFLSRSRSLLIKYTIINAIWLIFIVVNSFYSIYHPVEPHIFPEYTHFYMYGFLYFITTLLLIYPLTQKKYFNKK